MEWLWEKLREIAVTYGFKLIAALALLIIGFKLTNFLIKRIGRGKAYQKMDRSAAGFIKSFVSVVVKIIIVVSAIAILGVPMSSITALVASAGVAIGLAVQGALSNLAGGIMILMFKPFRVGDYITSGDHSGTVRSIGVFYTAIVTFDNRVVTLPNGNLTNAVIVNYTEEDTRRVDITVSASYNNDIDQVKQTLMELVNRTGNLLTDPAPAVVLSKYSGSSIDYTIRAWCRTEFYWEVYFSLTENVKKAFDAEGIEIPYQQMDVHIKNNTQEE